MAPTVVVRAATAAPAAVAATVGVSSAVVVLVVAIIVASAVGALVAAGLARGGPGRSSRRRMDATAEQGALGAQLDVMRGQMRADLERVERVVASLGNRTSEQFGQVDRSLQLQAQATGALAATAQGLREALANPKARGQWGERMAEDVLRLAGFVEHVNYRKQTAVHGEGRGIPDFTFFMPKGHVLYMDVKFPVAAYLRHLEAGSDTEREIHRAQFLRDVRLRVRELARREYQLTTDGPVVEQVLLFLPNETISSFIFEHDPTIIDDALRAHVVLCSPVTLFAYLALVRQAFDSFMVEQTSDQILALLGRFDEQWTKYGDALDQVRRRFDAVHRELDQVLGVRRRALERPLRELEALRADRDVSRPEATGSVTMAAHSG